MLPSDTFVPLSHLFCMLLAASWLTHPPLCPTTCKLLTPVQLVMSGNAQECSGSCEYCNNNTLAISTHVCRIINELILKHSFQQMEYS
jgi:hypothetical protein